MHHRKNTVCGTLSLKAVTLRLCLNLYKKQKFKGYF